VADSKAHDIWLLAWRIEGYLQYSGSTLWLCGRIVGHRQLKNSKLKHLKKKETNASFKTKQITYFSQAAGTSELLLPRNQTPKKLVTFEVTLGRWRISEKGLM
jgi:hypothetical protein